MIQKLRDFGRMKMTLLLVAMSFFCVGLSLFRFYITETNVFLFLNWNLFLAFIPWMLTSFWVLRKGQNPLVGGAIFLIWLLFFPNSPYVLTDLYHLRLRTGVPVWFDLILILGFAWTSLMYGWVSLVDIEREMRKKLSAAVVNVVIVFVLFLSAFGVYLGRFLRWNSWDIISQPFSLVGDISDRVIHPLDHPRTYGVTLGMGVLLNMMYFSMKWLRSDN
jgi:uncharacterized membrane protein